jgi:hypothetical protein
MPSQDAHQIAERAERIYEQHLRVKLERTHAGQYVAIEPDSGEHYLGETLSVAGAAARRAHPEKPSFIGRIGQKAAVQLRTARVAATAEAI